MDVKTIEQILTLLKQNDVTDFELQLEGSHIKLSRLKPQTVVHAAASHSLEPAMVVHQVPVHSSGVVQTGADEPTLNPNLVRVESPLVGTFYRRPSPEAEPFVQEGSIVKKGDRLCIVEAMKLMNEIDAPAAGRIEKVLQTDGSVVEYGEVLFLINPNI